MDESDELTQAELDAQMGPEGEAAAWKASQQKVSDNPYDTMPAVDSLDQLTPKQRAALEAYNNGIPLREPESVGAPAPSMLEAEAASALPANLQEAIANYGATLTPAQVIGGPDHTKGPGQPTILGTLGSDTRGIANWLAAPQGTPMAPPEYVSQQPVPAGSPGQQTIEEARKPATSLAPEDAETMVAAAATPTAAEVQQKLDIKMTPVREAIADEVALNQANAELSKFINSEQQRQIQLQQELRTLEEKDANYVRAQSFGEIMRNGSFGQKILATFAVALGAAAQGLTGAKENPALEVINAEADRQAQKDKLSYEQKLSLKKQLLESAMNITNAAQGRFANVNTQQKLQLEYDKLAQEHAQIIQKMQAAYTNQAQTNLLTDAQLQSPIPVQGTPEERAAIEQNNSQIKSAIKATMLSNDKLGVQLLEKAIWKPNGELAVSPATPTQVAKFKEVRADIEGGQRIINNIIAAVQNGTGRIDPRDRAWFYTNLVQVSGKLRETFLGPGAMTQTEYERLYSALGDPSKLLSLPAIELGKLRAVRDNLSVDLAEKARGIVPGKWPLSKYEQIVEKLRAGGMSPREASERADKLMMKLR